MTLAVLAACAAATPTTPGRVGSAQATGTARPGSPHILFVLADGVTRPTHGRNERTGTLGGAVPGVSHACCVSCPEPEPPADLGYQDIGRRQTDLEGATPFIDTLIGQGMPTSRPPALWTPFLLGPKTVAR